MVLSNMSAMRTPYTIPLPTANCAKSIVKLPTVPCVQGTPLSKRLWNLPKLAPQKTLPHRFTAIPITGEEAGEAASGASMRPPVAAKKAVDLSADSPSYQIVGGDDRAILYADAVPNVDISYTVLNGAVKENLILKSADHGTITFRITGYGVEYAEENGRILFLTNKEEPMFELGTLFAEDANGKHTEAVSHSIEREGDSLLYTVTLDEAFLAAEDTVFPVAIDPSIMITGSSNTYDTCVDEEYPSSNYYLAESLWTGGDCTINRMRTFIKFDLPSNITASNVTNAYIHIKKREHKTPTVRAYRVTENWTSRTITWNNQPEYTPNAPSPVITLDSGAWYKITVTTMVKDWMKGTYSNYGFCLKEPTETDSSQKTKYYSSDAPSPNKPELVITYTGSSGETTPYYGSREYQYVNNTHVNCMGYALEYKQYIKSLWISRKYMVRPLTKLWNILRLAPKPG